MELQSHLVLPCTIDQKSESQETKASLGRSVAEMLHATREAAQTPRPITSAHEPTKARKAVKTRTV